MSGANGPGPAVDHERPFRLTCYLDATELGGSSTSLAVLIAALDPTFDVTVMGTSEKMVRWVAAARPGAKTTVLRPVRSKFDFRAIGEHIRAVRRARPDILHVNLDNPWTSQYGMLAGVLTGTPMVSVLHFPTAPWKRRQRWFVRPLARRVSGYVCVSHDSARFAESVLHLKPGSVRVIHNGSPAPNAVTRSDSTGRIRIGSVGRLAPEKGLDALVEAMRSLPECELVMVGEGPERAKLEGLVRNHQVGDRVTFAGWVEPPWTDHWAFDVLAMPSLAEGFPMVIVEAMLVGIPVVATTVGGIPEIVVPGSTGMLVPPRDPGALADALGRVARDGQLRQEMAARCRSVALEKFTAEVMAARFEGLYREVQGVRH
jgi:glycosyltransferase involved in cell wall biosynthesis